MPRSNTPKAYLVCMDCGKAGPMANYMSEARDQAGLEGWQTGRRGSDRVPGWEDDYCADCKVRHPRTYCSGDRKPCDHRSIYTYSRPKDGKVLYSCGSHGVVLLRSMIAGGNMVEVTETPA